MGERAKPRIYLPLRMADEMDTNAISDNQK
jgi:hypothetical protein